MRLQVLNSVDPHEWDSNVTHLGGTIFHSYSWGQYIKAVLPNLLPQYVTVLSVNGELLGLALMFKRSPRGNILSRLIKRLRMDSAPLVNSNKIVSLAEVLSEMERDFQRKGFLDVSIGSFASRADKIDFESLGFDIFSRMEFQINLDVGEEVIWRGLKPSRRNKINKARNAGVVITELPSDRGIAELRQLQVETFQKIVQRGGPELNVGSSAESDPLELLLEAKTAKIFGAILSGRVVSTGLFTLFNGVVYYTQSGHSQQGLKAQAPTLLIWEAIIRYRDEGARCFNLGGVKTDALKENSSEHGLYTYKKDFGGDILECYGGWKIMHRLRYKIYDLAKGVLAR